MKGGKPRVGFDCIVYWQAVVRETSSAAACLRLAETHHVYLFIKIVAPEVFLGEMENAGTAE